MPLNYFQIVFIILLIGLIFYMPVSGKQEIKKLKKAENEGNTKEKTKFYYRTSIGSWLPIILILTLIPYAGLDLSDIGFKWIRLNTEALSLWVIIPVILIFGLYFLYILNTINILKNKKSSRQKARKSITPEQGLVIPATKKEKKLWVLVALSAGITEEIVYRGYLFYALHIIFPALNLFEILICSTLIFGIGHLYLGKGAITSTILGFLYGSFFIVFNSLIPVIIVHALQDLIAKYILDKETFGLHRHDDIKNENHY